jgi:hypothetical protein
VVQTDDWAVDQPKAQRAGVPIYQLVIASRMAVAPSMMGDHPAGRTLSGGRTSVVWASQSGSRGSSMSPELQGKGEAALTASQSLEMPAAVACNSKVSAASTIGTPTRPSRQPSADQPVPNLDRRIRGTRAGDARLPLQRLSSTPFECVRPPSGRLPPPSDPYSIVCLGETLIS